MDKESVYLVVGTLKIIKKFAKHIKAVSAEEAKQKFIKEIGSAGSDINIESVFIQNPKTTSKRFG